MFAISAEVDLCVDLARNNSVTKMTPAKNSTRYPCPCKRIPVNPCFVVGGAFAFSPGRFKNVRNERAPLRTSGMLVPHRRAAIMNASQSPPTESGSDSRKKEKTGAAPVVQWLRVAFAAVGIVVGSALSTGSVGRRNEFRIMEPTHAETSTQALQVGGNEPIPLRALGVKQSDYLSERELRLRKTTQFSEAEEEIMELEEYEVATKWYRDLRALWAGLASVAGIMVLYKGGVLWERWIQEQERKDMEEEIKLTGTFISPRAVRKDDDDDDNTKKGKGKGGNDNDGKPPVVGDSPPGGIQSLEKLL